MKVEPSQEFVQQILDKYKKATSVDFNTGELRYDDIAIIWARAELLYHIFTELESLMADSALSIMKRIGKPYGTSFYQMMEEGEVVERLQTEENIFRYLISETMAIGWGEISLEKTGDLIIVTSEKGLPVGNAHRKNGQISSYAIDSYFLGYMEGFLSEMHKKPYRGEEVECVGKGDSRCLMKFRL